MIMPAAQFWARVHCQFMVHQFERRPMQHNVDFFRTTLKLPVEHFGVIPMLQCVLMCSPGYMPRFEMRIRDV